MPDGHAHDLQVAERHLPAAGVAQDHRRQREAEQGDPADRLERLDQRPVAERRARPRVEEVDRHLGRVDLPQLERAARGAARRSRPCPAARRSTAPCRGARTSRQVSARSSHEWVVTTWPKKRPGGLEVVVVAVHARPRRGAGPARRSRMPALTATLRPVSSRTSGTSSRMRCIVRSSGPRTASTMQNSDAPSAAVSRAAAEHLVGVEERRGLHRRVERRRLASRSGSPRGSRRSWPTGSPRPRPRARTRPAAPRGPARPATAPTRRARGPASASSSPVEQAPLVEQRVPRRRGSPAGPRARDGQRPRSARPRRAPARTTAG